MPQIQEDGPDLRGEQDVPGIQVPVKDAFSVKESHSASGSAQHGAVQTATPPQVGQGSAWQDRTRHGIDLEAESSADELHRNGLGGQPPTGQITPQRPLLEKGATPNIAVREDLSAPSSPALAFHDERQTCQRQDACGPPSAGKGFGTGPQSRQAFRPKDFLQRRVK